jgi:Bacterial PH domain
MLFEKIELEPGEVVLITVRKHWFVIFSELFGSVILALAPLCILIFFMFDPELPDVITLSREHLLTVTYFLLTWVLLCTLTCFTIWTHYYLDLWLITDRRIIVIDQVHFFNRKVSSFRLERLQDVKVVINGIIPTFLNYGTLHAHTAGSTEENFTTTGLPDPRELQAIIQKATDTRLRTLSSPLIGSTL